MISDQIALHSVQLPLLTLEGDARGQPQSVAHGDRKLKQEGTHWSRVKFINFKFSERPHLLNKIMVNSRVYKTFYAYL